jgi:hypothetical protein
MKGFASLALVSIAPARAAGLSAAQRQAVADVVATFSRLTPAAFAVRIEERRETFPPPALGDLTVAEVTGDPASPCGTPAAHACAGRTFVSP